MVKKIIFRILLALGLVVAILAVNLFIFGRIASRISEGTPIPDPLPPNTALLVIDIQGGTTGEASALDGMKEQSGALIKNVNILIEESHSADQLIVYIRTEVVNPLINMINNTMARGSEGAELDPRLVMPSGEVVVKRRNDPFMRTNLDQILADHQVGKLILVGLDASQCVRSTVLAALNRGYDISVIEEAVITHEASDKAQAIEDLKALGVEISSMD